MMQQLSFFDSMPRKARSFHSRKPIPGPASEAAQEIKRGEKKASKQDAAILAAFKRHPFPAGPSTVWKDVEFRRFQEMDGGKEWPLTSIRRAMSNLTKRGLLRMLPERVEGLFGEPEHLWELVPAKEGNQ